MAYDVRVNLHVWVACPDGAQRFHVIHIGFFPGVAAKAVVERLDARGIAFFAGFPNATGDVDVVTCRMGPKNNPEVVARRDTYPAPKTKDAA